MRICKDGHRNEANGCCCPVHGNTCGYHPEWSNTDIGELAKSVCVVTRMDIEELAASSPEWKERLEKYGYIQEKAE